MDLYVFSSDRLDHIDIALAHRMWALPPNDNRSRDGRALNMPIGALGLFYAKPTKSLMLPFVVETTPDPDRMVTGVWPGSWGSPFSFHPLGNTQRTMSLKKAKATLPSLIGQNAGHVLRLHGQLVFAPARITEADWYFILRGLGTKTVAKPMLSIV